MDSMSIGRSLNLFEEYIPKHMHNRPGVAIKPSYITVHNTSNTNVGADADAHSRMVRTKGYYMHKGKKQWVSWHFTVDDRKVIKQLPLNELAYHAGSKGNKNSIAIETCMNKGINHDQANDRLARLVAALLSDLEMDIKCVVPHKHWTGKNCPILILAEWDQFIADVKNHLSRLRALGTSSDLLLSERENNFDAVSEALQDELPDFDIDHELMAEES